MKANEYSVIKDPAQQSTKPGRPVVVVLRCLHTFNHLGWLTGYLLSATISGNLLKNHPHLDSDNVFIFLECGEGSCIGSGGGGGGGS